MSKGLGASGRLITALVINQLKVNEREWACPYTIKQAAEDMSWAKLQGREVLERFAEAEKIEIPEGWGRLNQNEVPASYLDSNNQPGPLFWAMKKIRASLNIQVNPFLICVIVRHFFNAVNVKNNFIF